MGPRNLLILFFSTVAVSLVILIIFFSLFFKSVNLDFNTRLPESAPDVGSRFSASSTMSPDSKADGLSRSTVNVPPEFKEPEPGVSKPDEKRVEEEKLPSDADLPPISDDALLENDYPQPIPEKMPARDMDKMPGSEKTSRNNSPATAPSASRASRPVEQTRPQSVAMPNPIDEMPASEPEQSGPPVPQ